MDDVRAFYRFELNSGKCNINLFRSNNYGLVVLILSLASVII